MTTHYYKFNYLLALSILLAALWAFFGGLLLVRLFSGKLLANQYLLLVFSVIFIYRGIRLSIYPAVDDTALEIRWILTPFMNKRFEFAEIDRIRFYHKSSKGKNVSMTVFMKNGKKHEFDTMAGMKKADMPGFIRQLKETGLNVETEPSGSRITDS